MEFNIPSQITFREVGFAVSGFISAIAVGFLTWTLTENQRLNMENEVLKQTSSLIQQTLVSANTAKLRAEDAQNLVLKAAEDVAKINSTIDATKALNSAGKQMQELRKIAKSEAERIVNQYIKESAPLPILAALVVKNGSVQNSSLGVTYTNGVVSFPNTKKVKFVPIVSDYSDGTYMTEKVYVNGIVSQNQFKVWKTTLDTGSRNGVPSSFTAVVISVGQ